MPQYRNTIEFCILTSYPETFWNWIMSSMDKYHFTSSVPIWIPFLASFPSCISLLRLPYKIAQVGWLTHQKLFFLMVLEDGKSKINVLVKWISFWGLLAYRRLCSIDLFFVCRCGEKVSSLEANIRALILLDQDPTLWPHLTLITSLLYIQPTLGVRDSTYDLCVEGRGGHKQSIHYSSLLSHTFYCLEPLV